VRAQQSKWPASFSVKWPCSSGALSGVSCWLPLGKNYPKCISFKIRKKLKLRKDYRVRIKLKALINYTEILYSHGSFCQGDNTISHLLNSWPPLLPTKLSIFKNTSPINLLNEFNPDNLENILIFLKTPNLYPKCT